MRFPTIRWSIALLALGLGMSGTLLGQPAGSSAKPTAEAKAQPQTKPRSRGPREPFVPTPQDVAEKMLELAEVKKTDTVVDLGCGDGRIVVKAAQKYGCKAIGYELDKECLRRARASVKTNDLAERVQILEEDIFNADLSKVDVVTLYLWPTTNARLIPQLEKMKPGSRIVSHAANIPGVVPDKVITVKSKDDEQERKLYLWTVPLKADK